MRRVKKIKKLAGVIFMLTLFATFFFVGSIEQNYMGLREGMTWITVNYIVMLIAGRTADIIET